MWGAIVGAYLSYMAASKAAKAQQAAAGYDYATTTAKIQADKEITLKQLEFEREQFEAVKEQAKGTAGQTGSYGFPFVSVKLSEAKPALSVPLLIGGVAVAWLVFKKRRR